MAPTTPTSTDPADLLPRPHRVIARGPGTDAQVLLVLVTATATDTDDAPVWVTLTVGEAQQAEVGGGATGPEVARRLSRAEVCALDLDSPGAPFGLTNDSQPCWLARFDFSDHPILSRQWMQAQQTSAASAAHVLSVTTSAGTAATDAAPVHVRLEDVVGQPLFELGVLFIHGIGPHGVRETLVRWSEPIVRFWRDRGFLIAEYTHRETDDKARLTLKRWVQTHQLCNRVALDGIAKEVTDLSAMEVTDLSESERAELTRPVGLGLCRAFAARAEDTLFSDEAGQPSSTVVRLSAIDDHGSLREAHVLFSEAHWTKEAFPPTNTELRRWLREAVPVAVISRLHRLLSTRRTELADTAVTTTFDRWRLSLAWAVWGAQLLVLPGIYVAAALCLQLFVRTLTIIGILPVPWLRTAVRAIAGALIGTVGQSYSLQTSVIRRAAIVSSVRRNLAWLRGKCSRVVVLAHSQGAEIARLLTLDDRHHDVVQWYTAGAGILPLNMLHPKNVASPRTQRIVTLAEAAFAALVLALVLMAVDAVPGLGAGLADTLVAQLAALSPVTFGAMYVAFLVVVLGLAAGGPSVQFQLRRSMLHKWHDFYASDDPVPAGSLFRSYRDKLKGTKAGLPTDSRIHNTRFALLDHTTYFNNMEQFVGPIAVALLGHVGLRGDVDAEGKAFSDASRRRDIITGVNLVVTLVAGALAIVSFAWSALGPTGRLWWLQWHAAAAQASGGRDAFVAAWHAGVIGQILRDSAVSVASLVVIVASWFLCAWRLHRSKRALLADLAEAACVTPPATSPGPS